MESTSQGRPRDDRIDSAVLQATLEELAEVSFNDFTLRAVAARAGTSVPAIRRRWPSKAHLVHQAVFPEDIAIPPRRKDTSLRDEVEMVVGSCALMMSVPSVVRAMTGLLSELSADEALREELTDRLRGRVWEDLTERLVDAAAREGVDLAMDVDALVEAVFGGALMAAMIRPAGVLDEAWCDGMTDLILNGIRR